ncbi:MAG: TIR domain-containing protein [Taibaiella sp.]|nr:TIR domain-containing protein [Taibaiella sp.]
MAKWADYCISKLTLVNGWIETVIVYTDNGDSLSALPEEKKRTWMVAQVQAGKTFCSIRKNSTGTWNKIGDTSYDGQIFTWYSVPKNIVKRKAFVSYYHKDDEKYRLMFENLFDDLITSKSVKDGDINPDNSPEYTKMLIQNGYLQDTTVLVVLIGEKTKCRKHVDWEISGALDYKVGDKYAGVLGLFLPTHSSYGSEKYTRGSIPKRLEANAQTGYAVLRDWTEDREKMQEYIEEAVAMRENDDMIENKSIPQMTKDECE